MPLLSDEDLKRLREREPETCAQCQTEVRQNYCRQCDVFFKDGHKPDCPALKDPEPYGDDHRGHRTY